MLVPDRARGGSDLSALPIWAGNRLVGPADLALLNTGAYGPRDLNSVRVAGCCEQFTPHGVRRIQTPT